jgi:hypothetical protein
MGRPAAAPKISRVLGSASNILEASLQLMSVLSDQNAVAVQVDCAAFLTRLHLHAQDALGVELTSLIDDPSGATVEALAHQAAMLLGVRTDRTWPSDDVTDRQSEGHARRTHAVAPLSLNPADRPMLSPWIPAVPVSIKLRLYCLPYAGGVSENVFARCDQRLKFSACRATSMKPIGCTWIFLACITRHLDPI